MKMKNKTKRKAKEDEVIQIGVVGVDSGQVLICDPCYIDSEWVIEDLELKQFKIKKAKNNFSYPACCEQTLTKSYGQLNYKMGHAGIGVVSSSGWGDGCYPVYAIIDKKSGRVKELRIKFF
jgi:hypothetical protein